MLEEFKKFAIKGNVIDLAVGIILGAAFTGVVNSLVKDVLMPPLGFLMGGLDFSNFFFVLKGESYPTLDAAQKAGSVTIAYGLFVNTVINFLIVSFAVFLLVKQVNRLKRNAENAPAPPAPPSAQETLLTEIRDLLKQR